MKKVWNHVVGAVVFSLVFSNGVNAKEQITKDNFDYQWYLEKHPELAAVVDGNDQDAIWDFYQNIGEPAGWNGRIVETFFLNESTFDFMRYANENPDLLSAFGTDKKALYQHYVTTGVIEGRNGYSVQEEVNARIQIYSLVDEVTAECNTDVEKIKAVHDWLVKNVAYDYDNYVRGTIPDSSYEIAGPIFYGKAVCQGYAETFECFMDAMGIECEMVTGTANNGNGLWIGHAWNKVKVDGNWYYIDVTWDDPLPDRGANVYWYQYYLVTDQTFGGDHRPRK